MIPDRRYAATDGRERNGTAPRSRLSKERQRPWRAAIGAAGGQPAALPAQRLAGRGQANEAVAGTLGEPQCAMGDRSFGKRRINGGKSAVATRGRAGAGAGGSLTHSLCPSVAATRLLVIL